MRIKIQLFKICEKHQQQRQRDDQQTHEKMISVPNYQETANQNHNEVSPHYCQNGCYQKYNKS